MNKTLIRILLLGFVVLGLVAGALFAYLYTLNPDETDSLTAILNEVQGQVQARPDPQTDLAAAHDGQEIVEGGQVLTAEDGRARLDLSSGTIIRVGPFSTFTLQSLQNTPQGLLARLKLDFGEIWVILKGGTLEVETDSGVAAVRGSYMSISVDQATGIVTVTCLEGDCQLGNGAGSVNLVAGQTAEITNLNLPPAPGIMSEEQVLEWLAVNPEATVIIPAVTATANALQPDVVLPELSCLQDNSCATYCAPPGWDPLSGTIPSLDSIPQECIDAAQSLLSQGVDPQVFVLCVLLGGDAQTCADTSAPLETPEPDAAVPQVQLPNLPCIQDGTCATYCAPPGWDPVSGEIPDLASVPQECIDAVLFLAAQGVDTWAFTECLFSSGDIQACADGTLSP